MNQDVELRIADGNPGERAFEIVAPNVTVARAFEVGDVVVFQREIDGKQLGFRGIVEEIQKPKGYGIGKVKMRGHESYEDE